MSAAAVPDDGYTSAHSAAVGPDDRYMSGRHLPLSGTTSGVWRARCRNILLGHHIKVISFEIIVQQSQLRDQLPRMFLCGWVFWSIFELPYAPLHFDNTGAHNTSSFP